MGMIEKTPVASKIEVQEYHNTIIERLDSEKIILIPNQVHRNLHQAMWMKGHEIYENMFGEKAYSDFIDSFHRERFDIWYVKKYIIDKKLNDWEMKMVEEASRECLTLYKHPLAEILESEIFE